MYNSDNQINIFKLKKESDLNVLKAIINDLGANDKNSIIFKNLLSIESIRLWNYIYVKSDPLNDKLIYADFVRYITLFKIKKLNFCAEEFGIDLNLLIFVFSRVDAFKQRKAIRTTWALNMNNHKSQMKVLFVLGSSHSDSVQNKVIKEDIKYNDIIQWDFIDNYYNCTLKAIGILRWTLFHCKNVKFIMKTDDDILVNPISLNQFINDIKNSKNIIYGTLAKGWKPARSKSYKWYVSYESYSPSKYPDFIVGAYIISQDSIYPIYTEILNSLPALSFEDVYITGIIAQKCHIMRIDTDKFLRLDWIGLSFNQIDSNLFNNNILFIHNFDYKDLMFVWKNLNKFEFDYDSY